MTSQIEMLEDSFVQIKPRLTEFGVSFYTNLFAMYPQVKPLFVKSDLKKQQFLLTESLSMIVGNLRNTELLSHTLMGLGARHVDYGTLPEHYPLVGNVLLRTFEEYLEDNWTPELNEAWVDAYEVITQWMLVGAETKAISS